MSGALPLVRFRPFLAADMLRIKTQPSQWMQAGIDARFTGIDEARELEGAGEAWTAVGRDGTIIAIGGLAETFPGQCATAWAVLSATIGAAHLAITRFFARRIAQSPLIRIEALVDANSEAGCDWARLVGLQAVHVLRGWGADGGLVVLHERIRA